MIHEFLKGHHGEDLSLQEEYLDWFFLHYFGQGPGFHRKFSDQQINSLMIFESEKETQTWETWAKLLSKIIG